MPDDQWTKHSGFRKLLDDSAGPSRDGGMNWNCNTENIKSNRVEAEKEDSGYL